MAHLAFQQHRSQGNDGKAMVSEEQLLSVRHLVGLGSERHYCR